MKPLFKSKRMLTATLLALVMMVAVGATLALMASTSNQVTNTFAAADVDTEIEEVLTDGNKQVSIKNHGPSDAYVRARIMVSGVSNDTVQWVTEEPENPDPYKVYVVFNDKVAAQNIKDNLDLSASKVEWYSWNDYSNVNLSDACWYYYMDVLSEGEETTPLIKKVVLGSALRDDQEFLKNFSVTVYHESVLALNQNLNDLSGVDDSDWAEELLEENHNIIKSSFIDEQPTNP